MVWATLIQEIFQKFFFEKYNQYCPKKRIYYVWNWTVFLNHYDKVNNKWNKAEKKNFGPRISLRSVQIFVKFMN